MKIFIYCLTIVLVSLSLFLIGYLTTNHYITFWGDTKKGAAILRFIEPAERKSPYDLLDKLFWGGNFAVLTEDRQAFLFYDSDTGNLHRFSVTASDTQDELLQKLPPYLSQLQWSPDRTKLTASDGAQTTLYDLAAKTSRRLPQGARSPVFSKSGNKIAYIDSDGQNGDRIILSNPALEFQKILLPLAVGGWSLSWVDDNALALQYTSFGKSSLLIVDTSTGNLSRLLYNLSNLNTLWSPDGHFLLYSFADKDSATILTVQNMDTGQRYSLPPATTAAKCAWSIDNKTVFCAVDSNDQSQENDSFVILKIGETAQTLRINNTSKIKAENLSLSADEKYLFFRNAYDGYFYRLRIVIDQ